MVVVRVWVWVRVRVLVCPSWCWNVFNVNVYVVCHIFSLKSIKMTNVKSCVCLSVRP